MVNSNVQKNFLDRMFRRITGLVWEMTTGKLGVQDANGIFTLDITPGEKPTDAPTYRTSVNPFDNFGMAIPAFATQVPHDKVAIGDIVVGDSGILGWVIGKKEVALTLMDKKGITKNYTPPKVAIMGGEGILIVQNLLNLAGGEAGMQGLQGSLLPLMMIMGDDDSSLEKILPFLLFSQTQGVAGAKPAGGMDPMMLMLLSGKLGKGGSGNIDPMMLMMMSGMGGAGAMNPMMLMALAGGDLGGILGGNGKTVPGTGNNAVGGVPALNAIGKKHY